MKTRPLDISSFTTKLEALLLLCNQLQEENCRLHRKNEQLLAEKNRLKEKNHLSESQINGMVNRLKALEVEL